MHTRLIGTLAWHPSSPRRRLVWTGITAAFFSSNIEKVAKGAWFSLALSGILSLVCYLWCATCRVGSSSSSRGGGGNHRLAERVPSSQCRAPLRPLPGFTARARRWTTSAPTSCSLASSLSRRHPTSKRGRAVRHHLPPPPSPRKRPRPRRRCCQQAVARSPCWRCSPSA